MGYECRVEADSVSLDGHRLTTFVVTFPRFLLAELNTHRMLSRNAASSRAIPVGKRIAAIEADPFIPEAFGKNQKGMQANESLDATAARHAEGAWRLAAENAIAIARRLEVLGVHKQLANRVLEPFAWVTVVVSATEWNNFFALRCHPDAQPEFQKIAGMMKADFLTSKPEKLKYADWHLPFTHEAERRTFSFDWRKVSAGRCARVSYLTHDGHADPVADITLAERLISSTPKHASPFEHVARPSKSRCGNFVGWHQFRYEIPGHQVLG